MLRSSMTTTQSPQGTTMPRKRGMRKSRLATMIITMT